MKQDEFDGLTLWQQIEDANLLMNNNDARFDAEIGESLDRIRFLNQQISQHRTTDPALFTKGMVEQITYANIQSYLNAGIANENASTIHVTQALAEAEALYQFTVAHWPPLSYGQSARAVSELMVHAQAAVLRVRQLSDTYWETGNENQKVSQESLATLESRIEVLTTQISSDEARLDSALTLTNSNFTEAQSVREQQFQSWLSSQRDANDAQVHEVLNYANKIVTEMSLLQRKTEDLGTKVTQGFLAKDYGSYANREYYVGVFANILGVATLIVAAFALYRIVDDAALSGNVSWSFTILRLGFTLTVGAASAVLIRFGGQSLRRAEKSKRSELELRALTPLLASMDADTAQEVRKAFIDRSFGQDLIAEQSVGPVPLQPLDLVKLVELITTASLKR